jgi:carboxypeptidase Taq
MRAYDRLKERFHRRSAIEGALSLLQWDRAAMMPAGGAEARAEQAAVLETLAHGLLADGAVADWLGEAEAEDLSPADRANLREMRRVWVHAAAVPGDLVAELARAGAACEMAWRGARAASDFAAVRPQLEKLLALVRQEAAAKAAALSVSPYDGLLDGFEPGGRAADIDAVFADLAGFLPGFLGEVLERQASRPAPLPLSGPFPAAAQKALVRRVMAAMGFDFSHGRLDESAHPFCGGIPDDLRLTTRYVEDDAFSGLFSVIHETGHALYELGLPAAWRGQPAGEARGMSLHESQSLCMEMQAARGDACLAWLAAEMRAAFGGSGAAWSDVNLAALARRVERGFIRVAADEVTYPAHVILRYRLERAMIAGDLFVADLPGAWNEGFRDLLGVTPPDDARGCLQDIHWYDGAWGYFPTYTLGAMTAAQLFAAAKVATPGLESALARGDFSPLLAWMRANVHRHGALLETPELLTRATGRPLSAEPFKAHLRARYVEGA